MAEETRRLLTEAEARVIRRELSKQGRRQEWLAKQLGASKFLLNHQLGLRRPVSEDFMDRVGLALGIRFMSVESEPAQAGKSAVVTA